MRVAPARNTLPQEIPKASPSFGVPARLERLHRIGHAGRQTVTTERTDHDQNEGREALMAWFPRILPAHPEAPEGYRHRRPEPKRDLTLREWRWPIADRP